MIGVVIGRFQIHEMHDGHVRLLKYVQDQHRQVLVLVGCRHAPANKRDPLSYPMRVDMLREVLPEAQLLPIFDQPDDDSWSKQVDALIASLFPGQKALLYGGRDSFIPHYKGRFQTRELTFPIHGTDPSSTAMRELIAEHRRQSADFRAGVIHAMATLQPRIYMCVDIAVMRGPTHADWCGIGDIPPGGGAAGDCTCRCTTEVLLARKPNESKWRYIGGHVDITDDTLERAARRELREEAPNIEPSGSFHYICSARVEDWRDRDIPDAKHFTVLFETDYQFGNLTPADDIAELRWWPMTDTTRLHVVPDHVALYDEHWAYRKQYAKEVERFRTYATSPPATPD